MGGREGGRRGRETEEVCQRKEERRCSERIKGPWTCRQQSMRTWTISLSCLSFSPSLSSFSKASTQSCTTTHTHTHSLPPPLSLSLSSLSLSSLSLFLSRRMLTVASQQFAPPWKHYNSGHLCCTPASPNTSSSSGHTIRLCWEPSAK